MNSSGTKNVEKWLKLLSIIAKWNGSKTKIDSVTLVECAHLQVHRQHFHNFAAIAVVIIALCMPKTH